MGISSLARMIIPPSARATLRRSKTVNRYLAWRYGGEKEKLHPLVPYTLRFDGYRQLGWLIGSLADIEKEETLFAAKEIRRRNCLCAWDIGANVGFWSLFLAGMQSSIQEVISFEPDPVNLKFLRANRDRNSISKMQIREVGLSSHTGTATFFSDTITGSTGSLEESQDYLGHFYGQTRKEITINLSTIDTEIEQGIHPPDFIKMDVEGHELDVLRGGSNTLKTYHPTIVMEVTRNADEIGKLLRELGYRLVDPETGRVLDTPQFATGAVFDG